MAKKIFIFTIIPANGPEGDYLKILLNEHPIAQIYREGDIFIQEIQSSTQDIRKLLTIADNFDLFFENSIREDV